MKGVAPHRQSNAALKSSESAGSGRASKKELV